MTAPDLGKILMTLALERGPDKTFCPSEAARRADPENWCDLMDAVRKAASKLPDLKATQGASRSIRSPQKAPSGLV